MPTPDEIIARAKLDSWSGIVACAKEIVAETGDLPFGAFWELVHNNWDGPDLIEAMEELEAVRPPGAPEYPKRVDLL